MQRILLTSINKVCWLYSKKYNTPNMIGTHLGREKIAQYFCSEPALILNFPFGSNEIAVAFLAFYFSHLYTQFYFIDRVQYFSSKKQLLDLFILLFIFSDKLYISFLVLSNKSVDV
jgi:hypothetical protein